MIVQRRKIREKRWNSLETSTKVISINFETAELGVRI